ncbi:MAG: NADH-quinone oxidoreductase subunit A [Actinobacteria bacterium]|nr:NADH-quinone oxidoreductase subunit A [Actinomycetota bacterium]
MDGIYFLIGILVFILTGTILAAALVAIGKATSYTRNEPEKTIPYECGELPVVKTKNSKFSANYYSYALAFLIFDVEAALLIPWVMSFKEQSLTGILAATAFLAILVFGLLYAFLSGGLNWE